LKFTIFIANFGVVGIVIGALKLISIQ